VSRKCRAVSGLASAAVPAGVLKVSTGVQAGVAKVSAGVLASVCRR
jgi:hypothetical protein